MAPPKWSTLFFWAACLGALVSCSASYPSSDVIIVTNNDLDPQNSRRDAALFLKSLFTCTQARQACSQLQESLYAVSPSTGFSIEELATALTSERHGVSLSQAQNIWVAGDGTGECQVLAVDPSSQSGKLASPSGTNQRLPVLCTNSAPLTRSNVTAYDTSRQIDVATNTSGILTGFRDKFSFRFPGIKFGQAGRFQDPVALRVPSTERRSALSFGGMCAQPPNVDNGMILRTNEDCLFLNVYTPIVRTQQQPESSNLPVMFYIHEGGLNTGDSGPFPYNMTSNGFVGNSTANVYDGTNLVSYGGVVLVTINYRLSAFGWFNASNGALKDTLLALHWVQNNIAAFGGDPTKVLLFGQSSGGIMIRYLLSTNPKYTEGLFSAAIMESDGPVINQFFSPRLALGTSLQLAQELDCASATDTVFTEEVAFCVEQLPTEDIVLASAALGITWSAVIDGDLILADIKTSILDGVYARVPTIWTNNQCEWCFFVPSFIPPDSPPSAFPDNLGLAFNSTQIQRILAAKSLYPFDTAPAEDGISGAVLQLAQLFTDFLIHCPSAYLAALETATTNPRNAYKVVFETGLHSPLTPNPKTCVGQVCHADELYWVFATAETDGLYQPLSDDQIARMREVIDRWTSLVRTGSPNFEGAELMWPAFTGDNEIIIGDGGETIEAYRKAQCEFVDDQLGLVFAML
ncbi:alpha/beta-hydrolase [Trametes coccinea BRFM310]|uniref:Carboxylic ester hydrolase n=1 Tax=Trametes coccinea (strain BRFM310) TaxID=1353009 RepID=A0A1Y2ISL7_TRAC3|nr:alpha/beta-hydrolase [Trametes coccinea BRFM310]